MLGVLNVFHNFFFFVYPCQPYSGCICITWTQHGECSRIEWVWLHWSEYLKAHEEFEAWLVRLRVRLATDVELQLGAREKLWQVDHQRVVLSDVCGQAPLLERLLEEAAALYGRTQDPSVEPAVQEALRQAYHDVRDAAEVSRAQGGVCLCDALCFFPLIVIFFIYMKKNCVFAAYVCVCACACILVTACSYSENVLINVIHSTFNLQLVSRSESECLARGRPAQVQWISLPWSSERPQPRWRVCGLRFVLGLFFCCLVFFLSNVGARSRVSRGICWSLDEFLYPVMALNTISSDTTCCVLTLGMQTNENRTNNYSVPL